MNENRNQVNNPAGETLYVEPGTRQCRIFALRGMLRPGQSPEALLAAHEAKQVGLLEQGRIVSLDRVYWPTADETLLKGGMLLPVRDVASQAMAN